MPGKFGRALRSANVAKVDNHEASLPDKIEIRSRVLEAVGGRVFDAYAGTGVMHAAVWRRAPGGYVGCDKRYLPDDRLTFVGDCCRVMRNIDLQPFSIFDLDAYGSPWEACIVIAARRKVAPGERIGLALTDGSGLKLKFGGMPGALGNLARLRPQSGIISGGGGKETATRAILAMARRMNCAVENLWCAQRPERAALLYFGVVMVGDQARGNR